MKNQLFLALTVAFVSSCAFAQPQIFGKLPPLHQLPLRVQLQVDPLLPAYPQLDKSQPARLEIRVLETYRGPIFQLEVVKKSQADVLESIVAAMGMRSFAEPVLNRTIYETAVFRALSLEELLNEITGTSVETCKSSAGVYFFADKPNPFRVRFSEIPIRQVPKPNNSNIDPFNARGSLLNKIVPESHWGKIPFNGRDVYVIPLPSAQNKVTNEKTK